MNPKRGKAWICERCGSPHAHKETATTCCVCVECGDVTPYPGQDKLCERCGLEKTIESNLRHQHDLKTTLREQQARLARFPPRAKKTGRTS